MPHLQMVNVSKMYLGKSKGSRKLAVNHINLEIHDKEFVVLVGPSGCGKSTTLQLIAGLEEVTDGEIYLDGKPITCIPPKDRDFAMVFQSYALYPHMTVFENMAFALKLQKKTKQEIERRVNEAAEILDISEYLDRKPASLSGGEQQRVAIGRAIVRKPKMFLMDEPLSNLDAKLRDQMRTEIIFLRKRIDATFVYVTHDQTEAMTLGDRIVVMMDGEIQQTGTPIEVFNYPSNTFVANFIGTPTMNLLNCDVVPGSKHNSLCLNFEGTTLDITDEMSNAMREKGIREGSSVIMGFRPEHTTLYFAPQKGLFSGVVEICELLGSEIVLHIRVEKVKVTLKMSALAIPNEFRFGIPTGMSIGFDVFKEYICLFDSENGKNICVKNGENSDADI